MNSTGFRRVAFGCVVPLYRFYVLSSADKIIRRIDHEAPDAAAALEHAATLTEGSPVEVWDGSQLVFTYHPVAPDRLASREAPPKGKVRSFPTRSEVE